MIHIQSIKQIESELLSGYSLFVSTRNSLNKMHLIKCSVYTLNPRNAVGYFFISTHKAQRCKHNAHFQ